MNRRDDWKKAASGEPERFIQQVFVVKDDAILIKRCLERVVFNTTICQILRNGNEKIG
jgi:hypothetical protein